MYKAPMGVLTAAEAAERLKISVRRVQQLVKSGRLPAKVFGGALMIRAGDLKLVANRKTGRPPKSSTSIPKRKTGVSNSVRKSKKRLTK